MDAATPALANPHVRSHAGVEFFCLRWNELVRHGPAPRILVVGCGAGHEAAYIQAHLQGLVAAVDANVAPYPKFRTWPSLAFQSADVSALPYADAAFDGVFFHHVIEHVRDPQSSLREIARVLKGSGWLFIGTPNRSRLLSAVGAHEQTDWEATFANKLRENLRDWRARLTGRFRNELGAHAGFTAGELDRLLLPHFCDRRWLTSEYLRFKYRGTRLLPAIRLATLPALRWFVAPSIYAFCRRNPGS
jgi:SAM-dependent methyltransferase